MEKIKIYTPGLLVTGTLSLCAWFLSSILSSMIQLETLTIGIVLGMAVAGLVSKNSYLLPGLQFSLKKLLKVGIVLLGFKLNFQVMAQTGMKTAILVIVLVPLVLIGTVFLGKKMKVPTSLALLVGIGSSICGASAIVALAPIVGGEEDDVVVSVGVVSLLGAVGVLLYSAVGATPIFTDTQYGLWSGLSLQGVAHAIAAAFARGPISGELGTLVKMERVIMMVPTAFLLGKISLQKQKDTKSVSFPKYVLYFLIAGMASSLNVLPKNIVGSLGKLSSWLILLSMVAMGTMVKFSELRKKGSKAIALGMVVFSAISLCTAVVVYHLFS